jgi:hypothetical protein
MSAKLLIHSDAGSKFFPSRNSPSDSFDELETRPALDANLFSPRRQKR